MVREPEGVDFIVKSEPLTDEERRQVSEYIKQRKAELHKKQQPAKSVASSSHRAKV